MYIYAKSAVVPRNVLSGLSGLGTDRYIPPKNVDPATGLPVPSTRYPVPWGVVNVGLRNIDCRFYQNAPRDQVIPQSMPYTMEISLPGNHFVGFCQPNETCPEEVHQGANVRDPWRTRRCAAWREQWDQEAANIIADEEFRRNVTERVLDVAGITGASRYLVKPAEFLEVVQEREAREAPIKLFAFIFLAASGGILTFNYVRKKVKERAARKAPQAADAAMGEIQENAKKVYKKEYYPGAGGEVRGRWKKGHREGDPYPWELSRKSPCERYGYKWIPGYCR